MQKKLRWQTHLTLHVTGMQQALWSYSHEQNSFFCPYESRSPEKLSVVLMSDSYKGEEYDSR